MHIVRYGQSNIFRVAQKFLFEIYTIDDSINLHFRYV